jgi:hypothetical protein
VNAARFRHGACPRLGVTSNQTPQGRGRGGRLRRRVQGGRRQADDHDRGTDRVPAVALRRGPLERGKPRALDEVTADDFELGSGGPGRFQGVHHVVPR